MHLCIPGVQYLPQRGQSQILVLFLKTQKWGSELSFYFAKKSLWRTLEHSPTHCWLQVGNKQNKDQGALFHNSSCIWTFSAKLESTVQIVEHRWPVPPTWRLFLFLGDCRSTFLFCVISYTVQTWISHSKEQSAPWGAVGAFWVGFFVLLSARKHCCSEESNIWGLVKSPSTVKKNLVTLWNQGNLMPLGFSEFPGSLDMSF